MVPGCRTTVSPNPPPPYPPPVLELCSLSTKKDERKGTFWEPSDGAVASDGVASHANSGACAIQTCVCVSVCVRGCMLDRRGVHGLHTSPPHGDCAAPDTVAPQAAEGGGGDEEDGGAAKRAHCARARRYPRLASAGSTRGERFETP